MTSSTRQQAWVLLALVVVDAAVKLGAFHTLPADEPIHECQICVVLRVNRLSLGTAAQSLIASQGFRVLPASAVFCAVLAASLLLAAAKWSLTKRSVAFSLLTASLSGLAFAVLLPSIGNLPSPTTVAASRAGAVTLWLVIWVLSTSPFWKLGALLFSAAGISNLLSFAYSPYRVVDYLWSTPLNGLIGIGVFNVADVFWLLAFPVFAIALIVSTVRSLYSRRANRALLGGRSTSPLAAMKPVTVFFAVFGIFSGFLFLVGSILYSHPPPVTKLQLLARILAAAPIVVTHSLNLVKLRSPNSRIPRALLVTINVLMFLWFVVGLLFLRYLGNGVLLLGAFAVLWLVPFAVNGIYFVGFASKPSGVN